MKLLKNGDWLELYHHFDAKLIPVYKSIPHWSFTKEKKEGIWRWKCNPTNYKRIIKLFPSLEVNPRLHSYLTGLDKALDYIQDIKKLDDFKINDFKFKTSPLPHQAVGFEFVRRGQRTLLLDPMGTGKTKIMIDYANWLKETGRAKKCIVLCLKTILYNWRDELLKHSKNTDMVVVEGTRAKKIKLLEEDHFFYIMTWESVRNKDISEHLSRMMVSQCCLLGDECQKIKNHNSQVSRAFRKLYAPYVILATGTLIVRVAIDVFSSLNTVSGLWKTWTDFAGEFCTHGYFGGWELRRDKEIVLRDIVSKYSIKRDKSILKLPPKTYQRRYVELSTDAKKAYHDISTEFITKLEDMEVITSNILTQLLRLTEITTGFLRDGDKIKWMESSKLTALHEIVEEIVDSNNEKLVIWCHYKPTIKRLMEIYGKAPYNAVHIDGDVSSKNRSKNKNDFQSDPNIKIFIGQSTSGGVGIDLFSKVEGMPCSTAVRIEQEWSPATMRQAEDRIHRKGQTADSVTIIDIVAKDKIDEYIIETVERKEKVENRIVPISRIVVKDTILSYLG